MINEENAPTRADIQAMIDAEKAKPAYAAMNAAAKKQLLANSQKTFLQGKGFARDQLALLLTDLDSYDPPPYKVGREV